MLQIILGKVVSRPALLDQKLAEAVASKGTKGES